MKEKHFDYLVIGGGSGGISSANRAAQHGAKVAVVEENLPGGTCVNVGCVPKKVMWYVSKLLNELKLYGKDYGLSGQEQIKLNYEILVENRRKYIERLNGLYLKGLANNGVEYLQGRAQFVDNHTVEIQGIQYTADHITIATGGRPVRPDIPGAEYGIISDDIFALEKLPESLIILGGGYIGVEIGSAFRNFGVDVKIVEFQPTILGSFEEMLVDSYMDIAEREGFADTIHTGISADKIEKTAEGYRVHFSDDSTLEAEMVLWAAGRRPNTADLNLTATAVELDERGYVKIDKWQETTAKGVYAVGDVTPHAALTPVAIRAGRYLSERLFNGKDDLYVDYSIIPTVLFTEPPMGTVGLTEKEANETYSEDHVKVYTSKFTSMHSAITENRQKAYLKLVTVGQDEKVVGLHGVGQGMDELLEGFATAMTMGATKADFDRTIAIHPTTAEEFVTMT